ncbi:MAG: hypothetical protein K6E30_10645, partial [Lachnospiraceae bacterium]|nr:hypothetical protein [Lachnospiraceae bacterium]
MKKKTAAIFSLVMSAVLCAAPVFAEAETEADGNAEFLEALTGTYDELFTVICDPQYDQLWLDNCTEIVGEEMAEDCAVMLKAACAGDIYGQEAVDAYGDGSEGALFDCFFINGVSQFTFDGNVFSGTDEEGKEVFSHEYEYVDQFLLGGMMEGALYETADEDAGEFKYFVLFPDTPESTYHIEFRYGSDLDALAEYNSGDYAYWLAAGILADADQEMIENVIQL